MIIIWRSGCRCFPQSCIWMNWKAGIVISMERTGAPEAVHGASRRRWGVTTIRLIRRRIRWLWILPETGIMHWPVWREAAKALFCRPFYMLWPVTIHRRKLICTYLISAQGCWIHFAVCRMWAVWYGKERMRNFPNSPWWWGVWLPGAKNCWKAEITASMCKNIKLHCRQCWL